MHILEGDALTALYQRSPQLEEFGPDSPNPFIAVITADIGTQHINWLAGLPCPVVGVGPGSEEQRNCCDTIVDVPGCLETISRTIEHAPIASMVLIQQLRISSKLDIPSALVAESLAYSTLQKGPEFIRWLSSVSLSQPQRSDSPLSVDINDDRILIKLNNPASRNSIDTSMRDALTEVFELGAQLDLPVVLEAAGRCFSVGGEVREFGTVSDPAVAHWIRTLRLPASRVWPISDRLTVCIRGAAIGAGIEIAAFASKICAHSDAWFQLPELRYGLIPGAGGTVSLPRRIGRHRTAYMALTMKRIPVRIAQEWGLVDEIVE